MSIAGVIIAGGRSIRMGGGNKMLVEVGGKRILDRVIAALAPQVDELMINANDDIAGLEETGLTVVPDLRHDIGTPLAGLHTAISWAKQRGFDWALTAPSDTPFLPADLITNFAAVLAASDAPDLKALIAASLGQPHYLTGLWSTSLAAPVEHAIEARNPIRVQDFAREMKAATVEWIIAYYDPFFNVNTPQDLVEANRIARENGL